MSEKNETKPTDIDWSSRPAKFLQPDSEIPSDIIFQIVEDEPKQNVSHEVKAHKMILAMASPVFRKMFYVSETEDKTAKKIVVKETTVAAFQVMINAIYRMESIKDSLKEKTMDDIFAVLNMVVKYEIPELVLATRECLANFPIKEIKIALEIASATMKYSVIFQEEAQLLLLSCAKFLQPKFSDANSVFKFFADNPNHKDVIQELMILMSSIEIECTNCLQKPCQTGKTVQKSQFRAGLVVANDKTHPSYWGLNSNWGITAVTSTSGDTCKVNTKDKYTSQPYEMF